MKEKKTVSLVQIQKEVMLELSNREVMNSLVSTTFKGLNEVSVKQAITEGMMRGFTFKDFLEKNIYAVPFRQGYSLITSIDYARKIGMRSGVVGKSAPDYEVDESGGIVSCTITIKKKIEGYNGVGEFTETVYFKEYTTGNNLWVSKPRTMIAKVAEMHALRMACPEELSQAYVEEEISKDAEKENLGMSEKDFGIYSDKLEGSKNLKELQTNWAELPIVAKTKLKDKKENLKKLLTPVQVEEVKVEEEKKDENTAI